MCQGPQQQNLSTEWFSGEQELVHRTEMLVTPVMLTINFYMIAAIRLHI
jgi:hypothetical protein